MSSASLIHNFLYQLHSMGRNMDILKVSLLKCTTASETLVMHRTTFLCLSLVPTLLCRITLTYPPQRMVSQKSHSGSVCGEHSRLSTTYRKYPHSNSIILYMYSSTSTWPPRPPIRDRSKEATAKQLRRKIIGGARLSGGFIKNRQIISVGPTQFSWRHFMFSCF